MIESLNQIIEICKKGTALNRIRDKTLIDTIEQMTRSHTHRIFVLSGGAQFTQEVLNSLSKHKYLILFPQLETLYHETNHDKNEL
jgi:tRNA G37 N-methylase TrmD